MLKCQWYQSSIFPSTDIGWNDQLVYSPVSTSLRPNFIVHNGVITSYQAGKFVISESILGNGGVSKGSIQTWFGMSQNRHKVDTNRSHSVDSFASVHIEGFESLRQMSMEIKIALLAISYQHCTIWYDALTYRIRVCKASLILSRSLSSPSPSKSSNFPCSRLISVERIVLGTRTWSYTTNRAGGSAGDSLLASNLMHAWRRLWQAAQRCVRKTLLQLKATFPSRYSGPCSLAISLGRSLSTLSRRSIVHFFKSSVVYYAWP